MITKKGRHEFLPVATVFFGALLSFFFATMWVVNYWLSTQAIFTYPIVAALVPWINGFLPWIVMGAMFLWVFYRIKPNLPSKTPKSGDDIPKPGEASPKAVVMDQNDSVLYPETPNTG